MKVMKNFAEYVAANTNKIAEHTSDSYEVYEKYNRLYEADTKEFIFDDDPDSDTDLIAAGYDTIEDASNIDTASELAVLKKRAKALSDKWKDTFKQISALAKQMNLTAEHNDSLEITLKKLSGDTADIEAELSNIEDASVKAEQTEDSAIDDEFGPSEYEDRAAVLQANEVIPDEDDAEADAEAKMQPLDYTAMNINNDEVDIDDKDIDDDF